MKLSFACWLVVGSGVAACTSVEGALAEPRGGGPVTTPSAAVSVATAPSVGHVEPSLPAVVAVYPWGPSVFEGGVVDGARLDGRFRAAPPGFVRVEVAPGSFGAFLRTLPLKPAGSPVVDFRDRPLHDGGRHPNIVAVADLDVGQKDLQHCADAIIRLHAEWLYGTGERNLSYRTVSGQPLSYKRFLAGERAIVAGNGIVMQSVAAPQADTHASLRRWLEDVFSWAGTASVERDAKKVPAGAIAPGDFFVMSGSPYGHAVLVLDVARDGAGRTALLLGQSYMPAQSFQILKPSASSPAPWFVVEPDAVEVETPFWRPFPIAKTLRRW